MQLFVPGGSRRSLRPGRMGKAMAADAADLIGLQPFPNRMVALDPLELRRLPVALQTVVVVEPADEPDRLLVGSKGVLDQVAETVHLRLDRPVEAVILVAGVTLLRRDPPVFVMPGRQRHALRVHHVVGDREHHMAAKAARYILRPLEDMIVSEGENGEGDHQEGEGGEPLVQGREVRRPDKGQTEGHPRQDHGHPENFDRRRKIHLSYPFSIRTAVTLNSGCLETGSKKGATT